MNFKIHLLEEGGSGAREISQEDIPIFHLELVHRETAFARLKITTSYLPEGGAIYQHIALSYKDTVIFKGVLQALPARCAATLMTLCYIAQPQDYEGAVSRVMAAIEAQHPPDPLFVSHRTPLLDALEALPQTVEWNRVTAVPQLCDILGGPTKSVENIFYDSLETRIFRRPYRAVRVEVHAQWMQQHEGVCDLSGKIQESFPQGLLSTLTGQHLQKSWWQTGESALRGAFRVIESKLEEHIPQPQEQASLPAASPPYGGAKHFKRYWFAPQLRVLWRYRQPRRETFLFTLAQGDTLIPADQVKQITLHLNDIVGPKKAWAPRKRYKKGVRVLWQGRVFTARATHIANPEFDVAQWEECTDYHTNAQAHLGTFFLTSRGQGAARHALKIAKNHLLASARGLDVSFSCPLENALTLDTTKTLCIVDARLPGGRCQGKIKEYRFHVSGKTGEAIARVTLSVCVGTSCTAQDPLRFADYSDQMTSIGIPDPRHLRANELLESLRVDNDYTAQHAALIAAAAEEEPKSVLNRYKTRVVLSLKDLQPAYPYHHQIHATVQGTFQAAHQIGD